MPPQGYGVLAMIGWNLHRGLTGRTTICQFARRHKVATAFVLVGGNVYLWPHLYGRRR